MQPLLFQVWNEGASAYLDRNVAKYNPAVDTASPDFEEGNLKHSINGYLYCSMPDVSSVWLWSLNLQLWGFALQLEPDVVCLCFALSSRGLCDG